MPVVITPDSELGKELAKWEQFPSLITQTPGNPYRYRPFPKMVYKAFPRHQGKVECLTSMPQLGEYATAGAYLAAESAASAFNSRCTRTVESATELEQAQRDGWRESPDAALAYYEGLQRDVFKAAAETQFNAKRMSPEAQAELAAADEAHETLVTDVRPKRKRGRPVRKISAAAVVDPA